MRIDATTSAVVTGGASGLGEATVRNLAAAGAPVVIVDLNKEKGDALAQELGDGVEFVPVDVTDEDLPHLRPDGGEAPCKRNVPPSCAPRPSSSRSRSTDPTG